MSLERIRGRTVETWTADLFEGVRLLEVVAASGLAGSRGQARRMIQEGAVYVNDAAVGQVDRVLNRDYLRTAGEHWPAAVWIGTKHRRHLVFLVDSRR